jgi:hypothetical protein
MQQTSRVGEEAARRDPEMLAEHLVQSCHALARSPWLMPE